jgi:hypothetical protein
VQGEEADDEARDVWDRAGSLIGRGSLRGRLTLTTRRTGSRAGPA